MNRKRRDPENIQNPSFSILNIKNLSNVHLLQSKVNLQIKFFLLKKEVSESKLFSAPFAELPSDFSVFHRKLSSVSSSLEQKPFVVDYSVAS